MKKSKFQIGFILQIFLSALFTFFTFAFVNAQSMNQQNVWVISNPQTNTSATIYVNGTGTVPVNVNTNTNVVPVQTQNISTTSCVAYLHNFHRLGDSGEEVAKLQIFLNNVLGTKLNGQGFYGVYTRDAVKTFQNTYGIKVTGVQHVMTTDMVNKIQCGLQQVLPVKKYVSHIPMEVSTPKTVVKNVYPNASSESSLSQEEVSKIVKEYANANSKPAKKIPTLEGKPATDTMQKSATGTSLMDNLKSDFEKIKDNYKAYLLVFALVLALFWFLKKAATE